MGVIIRSAKARDVAGLTVCIDLAYARYAKLGVKLPPVSEGVAEDIRDHHVWVADDAGQIIGGLILMISEGSSKLANVAVHPDHGGRGIGRLLIDSAIDASKAAGCHSITLVTHAAMPDNIHLYEHLGWRKTGAMDHKVFMSRPI
ncbi:acetyltransferase [Roseovarius albus]|uniref:Acetyltransferase n=1 Tax=Roseovarius albus TaxID=1247867 RepID=A0A1X6ZN85_9RHOB|nr:GNAT family N-acetyltransferase [Roseovarius albus]SLN56536.1 acetyltransferase [Roseovarius albus]